MDIDQHSVTPQEFIQSKICQSSKTVGIIEKWKAANNRLVFTNGVFDILHIGHISYLAKAREFGDKLIVGLNADDSVKRLKGNDRPINNQDSRAGLLASLFFVDAVVIFNEDTPLQLIETIMPDILVKGADYVVENIVGAKEVLAKGGTVQTIEFIEGYSSTTLINKMNGK